jgi:thiol-disulfide isomerase/thioredoxin
MKRFLVALLLCLCVAPPGAFAATPGEVAVGARLREADLQGLSGKSAKLSDFRGKPLIINVWASWCGPCRQEMASLDRLARRYGGRHFNVIGISTDDYSDRAKAFLQQANTVFPHFIDNRLFMENMLGADRLPLTLLIDADGRVLHKVYGAREWDGAEAVEAISQAFGIKL